METSVLAVNFSTLASTKWIKTVREGQFLSDDCLKKPGRSHFSKGKRKTLLSLIGKVIYLHCKVTFL